MLVDNSNNENIVIRSSVCGSYLVPSYKHLKLLPETVLSQTEKGILLRLGMVLTSS